MAFCYLNLLLILAFLLFASRTPLANAYIYNGQNIVGIQVSGRLACTSTGNPTPGCQFLGNVPLILSCIGSSLLPVVHTTTNADGTFTALITDLTSVATLPLSAILEELIVTVSLADITNCPALPSTGFLKAPVELNSATVAQIDTGCLLAVVVAPFSVSAN